MNSQFSAIRSSKILQFLLFCFFQLLIFSSISFAEFETDPFLDQRVKLDAPPIDTISEHIEPYSGNMQIVQTDLHLPGNGGLDLTIMRSYNSRIWNRRGIVNPVNLAQRDHSYMGTGWSMHMGILRDPDKDGTVFGGSPVMELPDGSKQIFVKDTSGTARLISKDFWTLKIVTPGTSYEVKSPQGIVYTFSFNGNVGGQYPGYMMPDNIVRVAQVTKIQNPAGTAEINIYYNKANSYYSCIQSIKDSVGRVVTFNYENVPNSPAKKLTSITTDSRSVTYTYTHPTPDVFLLYTVTPPVGNAWQYGYDSSYELNSLTYPTGGKNTYTYDDILFWTGANCGNVPYRVVTQKKTWSRDGSVIGTWDYHYNYNGSPNVTVINGPSVTETHKFWGWKNASPYNISNYNVWRVGLPISKEYNFNGTLYKEEYTWAPSTSVISLTPESNVSYGCAGEGITDSGTYAPFNVSKTITRDGKTYATTNSNFNTYGDPQTVTETGDSSRTKTLTYCTNPTKNIVKGKPATESVTGSNFSGTSTTSWTYGSSSDCINVTQITKNGVTTVYEYHPLNSGTFNTGNLKSITDANNHKTSYEWLYGRISKETNPIYYKSRNINVDGTIESETNGRGYATHYLYDKNLRLTHITPYIGNPTNILYASDSSTRTDTRGGYSLTHSFDGFGRPSGSSDTRGVTTTIVYEAYGVKDYATSNVGDTTYFDYFGRPTQVVDKDSFTESYNYNAVSNKTTTTVTDKSNKTFSLTFNAFGNPDEKYLMSVRDQESNVATYSRNILGNLTGITQGSVTRSFTYKPTKLAFLESETNPENGTITYVRDNVGNIYQKIDATGTATYIHDEINRLKSISKNSEVVSFDYDNADNKRLVTSSAATITYDHDAVNRLHTKSETIAGKSYLTTYDYTDNDIIRYITYPSGRTVNYGINSQNQVESITGFVDDVNYYPSGIHAGLPYSYTFANGVTTGLTYNNRQFLTDITAGSALTAHYEYDSRGNTQSFSSNIASTQSFTYDDLSRLKTFSGAWGSGSFEYYPNGNRKTKSVGGAPVTTYEYNKNDTKNRLDSATGTEAATYSYNGNGTLIGGTWGGSSYTLIPDEFDNLTSFKNGGTTLASFAYDGDGQRVSKTADGKTTVYHYDQAGQVISEDDGNGSLIADYVYMNGKLVSKIVASPAIEVTPTTENFGNILISTTSPNQNFTVKNTGSSALDISVITISGTNTQDFTLVHDSCSGQNLTTNSICYIQIAFAPTSVGIKSANINIPSNDPQKPVFTVPLSGVGILPTLTVVRSGEGAGRVTSSPVGISCGNGGLCSTTFPTGSQVTLTASLENGTSIFDGWSGGGCSGTGSCIVTLNSNNTLNSETVVSAIFSTTGVMRIVTIPQLPSGLVGVTYSQSLETNSWAAPYTWSIVSGNLPAGLSLNASTGVISGTPIITDINNRFIVKVRDNFGTIAMIEMFIKIYANTLSVTKSGTGSGVVSSSPSGISCAEFCSAQFSAITTVTLTATPDDMSNFIGWSGDCSGTGPCSFSMSGNKNVIATFNAKSLAQTTENGSTGWSPQNLPISVTAGSHHSASGYDEKTFLITKTLYLRPGLITIAGSTLAESEGNIARYGLKIDGLEVSLVNGTYNNTYTGYHLVELYVYAYEVNEEEAVATISSVSIPIIPAPLLIGSASLFTANTANTFNQALSATGGVPPYVWSISSGTLLPGLTLNATSGLISGTPTMAGNSNFTVQVQDATGILATKNFTINSVTDPFLISTSALTSGFTGSIYSQSVIATGGVKPYAWSITSGSLPAGLSLNTVTGVISGTPTIAANSNFTIQARDGSNTIVVAAMSITVGAGSTVDGFINGTNLRAPWTLVKGGGTTQSIAATAGHSSNPAVDIYMYGPDSSCYYYLESIKNRNFFSFWYKFNNAALGSTTVMWMDGTGYEVDDGEGLIYWQENVYVSPLIADGTWRQFSLHSYSTHVFIQRGYRQSPAYLDFHDYFDSFSEN